MVEKSQKIREALTTHWTQEKQDEALAELQALEGELIKEMMRRTKADARISELEEQLQASWRHETWLEKQLVVALDELRFVVVALDGSSKTETLAHVQRTLARLDDRDPAMPGGSSDGALQGAASTDPPGPQASNPASEPTAAGVAAYHEGDPEMAPLTSNEASEGVADDGQASAVAAATPPFVTEQQNSNEAMRQEEA